MDKLHFTWRFQNKLLALLPEPDVQNLMPLLQLSEVQAKEILVDQGRPILHVDFPCSCVYSSIVELHNGDAVEVGTIGNEGITNVNTLWDARTATTKMICQIPGLALRMAIDDFIWALDHHPRLRFVLHLYGQSYLAQIERSVACNKLHSIEQRAARWLLLTHDRVGQNEFMLTQEFFAVMLGAQRPSVSLVAHKFQEVGALTYTRGKVRILHRSLLEAACCECYYASRQHFERLLGVQTG